MSIKIAINGLGRIGRALVRIAHDREDVTIVAINDTSSREMTKYLLEHDSIFGRAPYNVEVISDDILKIGNDKVKFYSTRSIEELEFAKDGAEVVIESTGAFCNTKDNLSHIKKGIKKVILSAPAKDSEITKTFVLGVNEDKYSGEEIVSNASCTTNCLAPIAKVLDDNFGIVKGLMTTVHSYTNGQNLMDVKHAKDMRRSRAAAINMIPTTTGAAKAMNLVMPNLKGKLHGRSVRVPTPNVSLVDFNVLLQKNVTIEDVNEVLINASKGKLQGILEIDYNHGVSSDFIKNSHSSIFAPDLTQVVDGDFVKVMSWYDNEWGYSSRLLDLAKYIVNK